MPTYQYACTECGHRFDAVQAFTDDALTTCPNCSGKLRKVFSAVGVVFKGSGFYRTDSRSSTSASSTPVTTTAKDNGSTSSSSSSSSSGSSDSKPASTPATTSTAAAS